MPESARKSLARRIFKTSNIKGEFLLRSGVTSSEYFDKYLFESDPLLLCPRTVDHRLNPWL
jgi:orotate phosphoribosyltransferase